ncbi:response regulator transcription factor [Robinsoniella peoriensis]
MDDTYLNTKQILLVDDEPELLEFLQMILKEDGYINISAATTVQTALELVGHISPDLAILDIMLPDGEGYEIAEVIMKRFHIPVIFLTAKSEDQDQIRGLSLGADDYILKPFLPEAFLLKIRAMLRRCYKSENPLVNLAGCSIDFQKAEVVKEGEHIALTAKEYEILKALVLNANRILTIDALCEAAWGDNIFGYEKPLIAHIRRIREKIERVPSKPESLLTVKGLGYKLIVQDRR